MPKIPQKTFNEESDGIEDLLTILDIVKNRKISYAVDRLLQYRDALYSRAKFKVGDRISLLETPDFNKAPGWLGAKHFLKKGALSVVDVVDFYENKFRYGLYFDNDSWIDTDGVVHKRKWPEKGQYWFGESNLELKNEP